jgi:hypothetical protein
MQWAIPPKDRIWNYFHNSDSWLTLQTNRTQWHYSGNDDGTRSNAYQWIETNQYRTALAYKADELLVDRTAGSIMALANIDDDNIGDRSISPVTLGLKVAYRKTLIYLDYSLEIDYQHWKSGAYP